MTRSQPMTPRMSFSPPLFSPPVTRLFGLATALPAHQARQTALWRFQREVLAHTANGDAADAIKLLDRLYERSGIEQRHSVLADYLMESPQTFEFFPRNWRLEPFPSTAARMKIYEHDSVQLAEHAARQAIAQAGIAPGAVTHIVISTCTGFFAPGPDVLLIERLGLRRTVSRSIIGFMGCYAGFNGFRAADWIVRAEPTAVVLQVAVELCTLHFQRRTAPDVLVANTLFGDGCFAAVWARRGTLGGGVADLLATHSCVAADSLDQMSWHIGDTGFEMRLSPNVPATLKSQGRAFVADLAQRAGLDMSNVGSWAIHPGGRKIVEAVADTFGVGQASIEASLRTLADIGNCSSASIGFVLKRELKRLESTPSVIAALGFGPGLTMEGALFQTVA